MSLKSRIRSLIPDPLISAYHFALAEIAAFAYHYPSRGMLIVAVTGTKGKSSVTEMVNAILEEAHYQTALVNSIRIKVGDESTPNTMRMSMPGRFFLQRLMRRAFREECDAIVLEMTSEGARQHRHRGVVLDALIFTNLSPEHIESHGSLQAYKDAKFEIGKALARSKKRTRYIVANADDEESSRYLALPVERKLPFSLKNAAPYYADEHGGYFTFEDERVDVQLPGEFSLKNALAAATLARAIGIDVKTIARAIGKISHIPGRAEKIEAGQNFTVVVDYAHTPDSLTALYEAYKNVRKVCVMGATGGGRDKWKRPAMGGIADSYCDEVVLTNEDPYDEDPRTIVYELASGMKRTPTIIMDRREAIRHALTIAKAGDAILITGKGTDPNIAGPNGTKQAWSDAKVTREEIERYLKAL
ncbi:MAG: UDP-N-acetylmuramyl-tripeptide synthetase [Candidatus Kaiserbacteria bacterium]|nr:UDP-N-acetylmuramyl-tripeptide synthetase [Candidatus Kaiserbacteria bacterium]